MSDSTEPEFPTPTPASPDGARRKRRRRWFFGLAALLVLGAAGVAATTASARPWGRHHGCSMHDPTPEEAREHVDRWMTRVLDRVDATDEQRQAVDVIVDDSLPQMLAFRREGRDLKQKAREMVVADPIDEEGLEGLRTQALDLANRASALGLDVFLGFSDVLTPEQRAELTQRWRDRSSDR